MRRPQHPEHLHQAADLLQDANGLADLWEMFVSSGCVPEVWALAALAWHIRQEAKTDVADVEPPPGWEERLVDRAKREGVLP